MSESRYAKAPPSLFNAMLEMRAFPEYYWGFAALPLVRCLPRGDGHPVLVLPGFLADKSSTLHLRWVVSQLGYRVFDWRLGRNTGPVGHVEEAVLQRVETIIARTGERPTLLGWSLGGVYARIIAHLVPQSVRSVITLGSPVRFPHRSTADSLYRQVSGELDHPEYLKFIASPPPVPATAVYSRFDGIVNWEACITDESERAENIKVYGSHCGLGYNPTVFTVVADRLAQTDADWQPFSWSRVLRDRISLTSPALKQHA